MFFLFLTISSANSCAELKIFLTLTFLISSLSFWENLGSSFTEEKIVAAVNTVFTTPRVARWLFSPLSLLFCAFSHSSEEFPVPTVRITSPSIGKNSLGLSPIWSFIFWNWFAMSAQVCFIGCYIIY